MITHLDREKFSSREFCFKDQVCQRFNTSNKTVFTLGFHSNLLTAPLSIWSMLSQQTLGRQQEKKAMEIVCAMEIAGD